MLPVTVSIHSGEQRPGGAYPTGSRATLDRTLDRIAVSMRWLWVFYATSVGLFNQSVSPALAVAFIAWAALMNVDYLRSGHVRTRAAFADGVAGLLTLILGISLTSPALRGDGSSWPVLGGMVSTFIAIWCLPNSKAIPVIVTLGLGYFLGTAITAGPSANQWLTLVYLTLGVILVARLTFLLRKSASNVDMARTESAHSRERLIAERVRLTNHVARERFLHDHVLSILSLLGHNGLVGSRESLRAKANSAAMLLRETPSNPENPQLGELEAGVLEIISEVRAMGLSVIVDQEGSEPPLGRQPLSDRKEAALLEAVRQSLINIVRHAQATATTVRLEYLDRSVVITVTDDGRGFQPDNVGQTSRGIRSSIVHAVQEQGGAAQIVSTPGSGTAVTLRMPMGDLDGADTDHSTLALAMERAGRRMVASIALGWHVLCLVFLSSGRADYKSLPLALAIWLLVLVAEVALVRRPDWWRGHHKRSAVLAVSITAALVMLALNCRPGGLLGWANWGLGDSGYALSLCVVLGYTWTYVLGVSTVYATSLLLILGQAGAELNMGTGLDIGAKFLGITLGSAACQVMLLLVHARLKANAMVITEAQNSVDASRAGILALELIESDRAGVFALSDSKVSDLLVELADGRADPDDSDVQARCRTLEEELRSSHNPHYDDPLGRDLAAFARSAREADVILSVSYEPGSIALPPGLSTWLTTRWTELLPAARGGYGALTALPGVDLTVPTDVGGLSQDPRRASIALLMPRAPTHDDSLRSLLLSWRDDPWSRVTLEWELDSGSVDDGAILWIVAAMDNAGSAWQ